MSTERESFEAWADSITPAGSPRPIRDAEVAWYAWQARAALAKKPALTDAQLGVLYRDWNLGRHGIENELYFTRPLPKQIETAFRDGARAAIAAIAAQEGTKP